MIVSDELDSLRSFLFSLPFFPASSVLRPPSYSFLFSSYLPPSSPACSVTVLVDPADHRRPLAVSHSPALPSCADSRRIIAAMRSPRPSMERLLDRCIEVRSRARLTALRPEMLCVCPGPLHLADVPLCLLVPPLHPCLEHERLRIHVDPHRGSLCVRLMGGSQAGSAGDGEECPHLTPLQTALNREERPRSVMITILNNVSTLCTLASLCFLSCPLTLLCFISLSHSIFLSCRSASGLGCGAQRPLCSTWASQ